MIRPMTKLITPKIIIKNSFSSNITKHNFASSSILHKFDVQQKVVDTSINKENGLNSYMKLVGLSTGKNLGITTVTGALALGIVSHYPELVFSAGGFFTWCTAAVTGIYSCYKVATINPTYKTINNNPIAVNSSERLAWSNLLFTCQGIVIAPSLIMFTPYIPTAAIVTTAITAGSISTALYAPKGSMLAWGPALYTSLWGLIGCGVVGIFIPAFHTINLYVGVGIFTLYNMYDTQKLIHDYHNGKVDHLCHSVDYSLNFINIFIRLLEILAKKDKKS